MKKIRYIVAASLLVFALLAWLWLFWRDGGVTHRELADKISVESLAVQRKVDERCDALDRKLDRIESKLDRLIQLATTPNLPDGMKVAE